MKNLFKCITLILIILILSCLISDTRLHTRMNDGNNVEVSNLEYSFITNHGITSIQHVRPTMEDEHIYYKDPVYGYEIYAVYDGHGGSYVSKFLKSNLHQWIVDEINKYLISNSFQKLSTILCSNEQFKNDVADILHQSFIGVNNLIRNDQSAYFCGSCANMVLLFPGIIFDANTGDSRAVLSINNKTISLSTDHKPNINIDETQRIIKLGGWISQNRVMGTLAITRAFGDFELYPYVVADPDISAKKIYKTGDDTNTFIVLGCDGLWDVMSSEDASKFVNHYLDQGFTPKEITARLTMQAIEKKTSDNISIIIIKIDSIIIEGKLRSIY